MRLGEKDFDEPAHGVSRTSVALDRLRVDILGGAFTPSMRLRVEDLKSRYGVSGSPMREALSRLVSEGLVQSLSQRGFRVAAISAEDLIDITETRQAVEGTAIERSIARGDDAWEGEILGAFHRFDKFMSRSQDVFGEEMADWEKIHKNFHSTLISACGSPRLIQFCSQLYDQGTPYRRLLLNYEFDPQDVLAEHQALLDAVMSRDAARARKILIKHMALAVDIFLETEKTIKENAAI